MSENTKLVEIASHYSETLPVDVLEEIINAANTPEQQIQSLRNTLNAYLKDITKYRKLILAFLYDEEINADARTKLLNSFFPPIMCIRNPEGKPADIADFVKRKKERDSLCAPYRNLKPEELDKELSFYES